MCAGPWGLKTTLKRKDDYLKIVFGSLFMPYGGNQMYKSNLWQPNNLSTMTSNGTHVHEIGHALGLDDEYGKGKGDCDHVQYQRVAEDDQRVQRPAGRGVEHGLLAGALAEDPLRAGGVGALVGTDQEVVVLAALEIATAALREAPDDLGLLALAIDCGFAVGADSASRTRLERLTSIVDGDPAWEPTLERYARFDGEARSGAIGADGAIVRARFALLLAALVATVAIWAVSRRSFPATA